MIFSFMDQLTENNNYSWTALVLECSLTYIHKWSLQHFNQDFDLASHTTYVVCINFRHEWRDLQFKVDSKWQIFVQLFMVILFTLRVYAGNLPTGSRSRNIYLHNLQKWPLQPFSQDFDLASHTTHVVCLEFIQDWRDLHFNVNSYRQIFEKLFMAGLFTPRVFVRNLLWRNRRSSIFFIFRFDSCPGIRTRALRSTTHYLLRLRREVVKDGTRHCANKEKMD